MSRKSYSTIGNFGTCLLVNNQYGYDVCMFDGIDKCFAKGPGPTHELGPSAPNCQAFLAEQCSVEWNPKCELYYRTHNQSLERYLPNTYTSGVCQYNSFDTCGEPLLLGDSLLKNAAELRFFDVSKEHTYTVPLDPTNYSSPMITKFINRRSLEDEGLSDRFNKDTIDSDIIMQKLLQNPKPFYGLLNQIFQHVIDNIELGGIPDVSGYVDHPQYNPHWDIRGTRTWDILNMLFGSGQNQKSYYVKY